MSSSRDFSALLNQAQKLTADIQNGEELPSVRRNLQQIAEAGQRLLNKTSGGVVDDNADVKAAILLGSQGIDVPRLSRKLESLNAVKTLEPIEPVWETDIQGFLRNERENTLLAIIEESRKNTFAEAERHHWESMEKEWEKEKEKILNSLLGSGQELEFPTEPKIMHSTPLSMHGRSALDAVAMAYAREVYIRNESHLQGLSHNLVTTFHEASLKFVDKNVQDSWSLLKTLIDIPCLSSPAYKQRSVPAIQRAFMNQARIHLERRYLDFIKDTVNRNLSHANLGGKPGTYVLVRSFLRIRQASRHSELDDGTVDGQPIWAMIFYCLRCGDMEAAMHIVKQTHTCAEFAGYLEEYIQSKDFKLPPSSESKLQLMYKRLVHASNDPFKKAVYCVLARCEVLDNHQDICSKTEDYMWLKICQLKFDDREMHVSGHTSDRITLPDLQHLMLEEYGESYFNAHQQPYIYFTVLLLTLQFEAAIEFLSRVDILHSHAVHFAIALHDMNLLYLTDSTQSKLIIKDPTGVRQLNFANLIISYTRRFSLTDVREALQYYYLLKGMCGAQNKDLFNTCVSDLVMESREFEMLLGKVRPDGTIQPGCVDKFQSDTSQLISFVAEEAEEKGLYEDAIRLYDLAKNHTKVLELMNRQLSHVASSPGVPQSDRERIHSLAIGIADCYKSTGHTASRQLAQTFYLLLDIMQFFDYYHTKRIDVALDVMNQLHLLPLMPGESIEQKVGSFRSHGDEIRRCLPDIILATMSILYTLYKQTSVNSPRSGVPGGQDGGQETFKADLRRQAKILITFSGMLPYQMPGDTNARLVQMEVLMA